MAEIDPSLSLHERRKIETLTSPQLFDELLALAVDACLTSPLPPAERPPSNTEAEVVAMFGIRGLNAAMNFLQGSALDSLENERDIRADTPLKHPEWFGDTTDLRVVERMEAFGKALTEDAYRCLGEDALVQIKKFKNPRNMREQLEVLDWLEVRLKDMADHPLPPEHAGNYYHPLRLSPKVIGEWPHLRIAPTCLGVSIIATSFFQKAGADCLHAGVMHSRQEEQIAQTLAFTRAMPELVEELYEISFPDVFGDVLRAKGHELAKTLGRPRAYHVLTYTRLKSGRWAQFDASFYLTNRLYGEAQEELDKAYETLDSLKHVAPGLEVAVPFFDDTMSEICSYMIEAGSQDLLGSLDDIDEILMHARPEAVLGKLKKTCIDPFFRACKEGELSRDWSGQVAWLRFKGITVKSAFESMFQKYVCQQAPFKEFLKQCRTQPDYRRERAEEIRALPFMVLASMAVADAGRWDGRPLHSVVEVGLPEISIGGMTLKSFASYCDDDRLPPSFWLSHLANQRVITEVMSGKHSPAQGEILRNNAKHVEVTPRYLSASGIIMLFLQNKSKRSSREHARDA